MFASRTSVCPEEHGPYRDDVFDIDISPIRIGVVNGIVALAGSPLAAVIVAPGRRDQSPSSR